MTEPHSIKNPDTTNPITTSMLVMGEKTTNADRIRGMSDEKLAKFIKSIECYSHGYCDECPSINGEYCNGIEEYKSHLEILDWLKQPVEE